MILLSSTSVTQWFTLFAFSLAPPISCEKQRLGSRAQSDSNSQKVFKFFSNWLFRQMSLIRMSFGIQSKTSIWTVNLMMVILELLCVLIPMSLTTGSTHFYLEKKNGIFESTFHCNILNFCLFKGNSKGQDDSENPPSLMKARKYEYILSICLGIQAYFWYSYTVLWFSL